MARTFAELLDLLARPIALEQRQAYHNASAMGGLDGYVAHWALEAAHVAPDEGRRRSMEQLRAYFADYRELAPRQRRERVERALTLLDRLRGAASAPPASSPKQAFASQPARTEQTFDGARTPPPSPKPPPPPLPPAPAPPAKGASATPKRPSQPLVALDAPLSALRGIGPSMEVKLKRLGLEKVQDLLMHFPRSHEDRSNVLRMAALQESERATVVGTVQRVVELKPKPKLTIAKVTLSDGTGRVELVFFNSPFVRGTFRVGTRFLACGKLEHRFKLWQMPAPDFEVATDEDGPHAGRIVPVYGLTEGVTARFMRKLCFDVVPGHAALLPEVLPETVLRAQSLPSRGVAVASMHFPARMEERDAAFERLVFEELFVMQVGLALRRQEINSLARGVDYALDEAGIDAFAATLPFAPTGAQRAAMRDIVVDLRSSVPMSRLVQGDVGSGKTVVAAFAAWVAVRAGQQAAIMAPTEILAEQLAHKLSQLLGPTTSVRLLKGAMSARLKGDALAAIANGEVDVVVGTHALIQDEVRFQRLAMVVIDEQHKFGVVQRARLRAKGRNPDVLVMTATPIPRTLTLTVYGDLDVSIIDELPPGRSPIRSTWARREHEARVYSFIRKQVGEGRQAYIVCPLIEESDKLEVTSAIELADRITHEVLPDLRVGLLHGRMRADEKDLIMDRFRRGEIQVLVSTTVIEVGVDVPNATVMLILDADRFGLAQLHQLRGRVGRGAHQSSCIFLAEPQSEEGKKRMTTIESTSDGFEIAEADLELRGPGQFYGARQSGLPDLKVADLVRDRRVLERARRAAWEIVSRDPRLMSEEVGLLRGEINRTFRGELGHLLS